MWCDQLGVEEEKEAVGQKARIQVGRPPTPLITTRKGDRRQGGKASHQDWLPLARPAGFRSFGL